MPSGMMSADAAAMVPAGREAGAVPNATRGAWNDGVFRDKHGNLLPVWRFLAIVTTFSALWPPLCGNVISWLSHSGTPFLATMIAVAIYSYYIGAVAGVFVGVVHAVAAVRFHRNSVLLPLVAGVLAPLMFGVQIWIIAPGFSNPVSHIPEKTIVVFTVASCLTSLICWRLTRPLARTT